MSYFVSAATLHSPSVKGNRGYVVTSPNNGDSREEASRCTYSTPHAPRHQKPSLVLGGSHSSLKLRQSYKYLNNDQSRKSWSATDLLDKYRGKEVRSQDSSVVKLDGSSQRRHSTDVVQPTVVQPYRRTYGPAPPAGIPLLDLRRFNEPDEEMHPIELVEFPHPMIMNTDRTDISWGTSRISPKAATRSPADPHHRLTSTEQQELHDHQKQTESPSPVLVHVHVAKDSDEEQQPSCYSNGVHNYQHCEKGMDDSMAKDTKKEENLMIKPHDDKLLKYVESRVVSMERSREELVHPNQQTTCSTSLNQPIKSKSNVSMLNERALSRRIRFSARILTQNGRDVHRELCGFFFLSDGSLTIYEFRQFGQRVSALPLIPRGIYNHPIGRRKGEVYEIKHIKKGATLFFESCSLTSLPDSLKKRSIVGIRLSDVDGDAKVTLMKDSVKPFEYSKVDDYLFQSPSDESKRHSKLLQTLQGMLRNRLKGRSSHVLVGLGRYLKRQSSLEGLVNKVLLQEGMKSYHISLTLEDFDHLWSLLQDEHGYGVSNESSSVERRQEGVWLDRVISGLVGEMSEERKSIVRKVFFKMDSGKSGYVMINDMQKYFSPLSHPDVVSKKKTVEELVYSLFGCLQHPVGVNTKEKMGRITYADFEHYYDGVSIETTSDSEFISTMMRCWSAV